MTFTELPWAVQVNYPILTALQLLPLLSMAVVLVWNGRRHLFWVGLAAALLELLLALDLYRAYDLAIDAMQFAEHLSLLGPLDYHAAADGITVLFVLLNALLTTMVVIYSAARQLQSLSLLLAIVFGRSDVDEPAGFTEPFLVSADVSDPAAAGRVSDMALGKFA